MLLGILRLAAAAAFAAALTLAATACKRAAPAPAPSTPEVVVTDVIQRDVPLYSEWVGTTEGFVNAQIHPKVSGYVLKQNYKDGDHVDEGQLLFQIDDREYKAALDQALGNLAQEQAQLKRFQQDLARYTALYKAAVISKQEFQTETQTTRASAAQVQAAEAAVESARLNMQWTRVTSPIGGIAGIAKTQVGDLVGPTTLLTTVSQLDPIKVTFPISEREYLHFAERIKLHEEKGITKTEPVLQMILADGKTYKYPGHFYVANRQVNVQTGTIVIQGIFPNPDYILRPGLYAKIRSATDVQRGALLIPQDAVLDTQGQYQVAVVGADNRVSLRTVKTGKEVGSLRIIKDGLKPGERVVTEGLQKVSDGMEVRPRLAPAEPDSTAAPEPAQPSVPSAARPAASASPAARG
ncbi:MAG TPA: efflux RND transporter periplasmic adaptor subunit [Candidatus Binataceae bacterium]|nr:efflux RND transporter periplasmic adaptor subunit [Candidatus Binataceae bacterium]